MMCIKDIFAGLFILAWSTGAVFLVFSIYETIAVMLMKESVYSLGLRTVNLSEPFTPRLNKVALNRIITTDRSKYKFVSSNRCLLRERWKSSHLLRFNSSVPIKGEVTFSNGIAIIQGRAPLGIMTFYSAWIFGAVVMAIETIVEGHDYIALAMFGIGTLLAAVILYFLLSVEKKRFFVAYEDFKKETIRDEA